MASVKCGDKLGARNTLGMALMFLAFVAPTAKSSGFYADNGLQQTVVVNRLPGRERREMQQEILTLLGLHHRPKPNSLGIDLSAPKYMLDLYRSLQQAEDDPLHFIPSPNATVALMPEINTSDVIMSFVNHGMYDVIVVTPNQNELRLRYT